MRPARGSHHLPDGGGSTGVDWDMPPLTLPGDPIVLVQELVPLRGCGGDISNALPSCCLTASVMASSVRRHGHCDCPELPLSGGWRCRFPHWQTWAPAFSSGPRSQV